MVNQGRYPDFLPPDDPQNQHSQSDGQANDPAYSWGHTPSGNYFSNYQSNNLSDNRFGRKLKKLFPADMLVTNSIIAVCLLTWLVSLVVPGRRVTLELGFIPLLAGERPWTLLTSAFVHAASPLHVLLNMFCLYLLGKELEPLLGRLQFLAVYLLSVLGGTTLYLVCATFLPQYFFQTSPISVLVGASGGVFGLFGALFMCLRKSGRDTAGLVGLLVVNAIYGFLVPGIAWQGHLGGFLIGLATGGLVVNQMKHSYPRKSAAKLWALLIIVAVVLVAICGFKVSTWYG